MRQKIRCDETYILRLTRNCQLFLLTSIVPGAGAITNIKADNGKYSHKNIPSKVKTIF